MKRTVRVVIEEHDERYEQAEPGGTMFQGAAETDISAVPINTIAAVLAPLTENALNSFLKARTDQQERHGTEVLP